LEKIRPIFDNLTKIRPILRKVEKKRGWKDRERGEEDIKMKEKEIPFNRKQKSVSSFAEVASRGGSERGVDKVRSDRRRQDGEMSAEEVENFPKPGPPLLKELVHV
jgi:hypothetical protein